MTALSFGNPGDGAFAFQAGTCREEHLVWSAISRSLSQFASARRHQSRRRFTLERLEGRSLLSTVPLTVNSLVDDPTGPVAGQVTLRDAIAAADAGDSANQYQIKFAPGLSGAIRLTDALPLLNNNISITGSSNIEILPSINVQTQHPPVFLLPTSETVTISGITISGNNNTSGGAAVINNGNLTLQNCEFLDSSSYYGAVYNSGTLVVQGCDFIGNYRIGGDGGGILNSAGTATVIDSVFSKNSTSPNGGSGGGIANIIGNLTLTDDVFIDNSAWSGGGVYNWQGVVTVTDSTFVGNSSTTEGGGFLNTCNTNLGSAMITGSVFVNNSARDGGGIENEPLNGYQPLGNNSITVDNSVFVNNVASQFGGGIASNGGNRLVVNNSVFVGDSALFTGNPTVIPGGGIYDSVLLVGTGNIFLNNTGGDVYDL